MVVRSGNFVRAHAEGSSERSTVQLSIDSLLHQRGDAVVGDDGVLHRERSEVTPLTRRQFKQRAQDEANTLLNQFGEGLRSENRFYRLADDGAYVVEFAEELSIPTGHVGVIEPRDVLLESGAVASTRFVRPGEDRAKMTLVVDDEVVLLSEDACIAELVVLDRAAP